MSKNTKLSILKRELLSSFIRSVGVGKNSLSADELADFTTWLLSYPDDFLEQQHRNLSMYKLRGIICSVYRLSSADLAKGLERAHQVTTDDPREMLVSIR